MFSDILISSIITKKSSLCLGLDPILERVPEELKKSSGDQITDACESILAFNKGLIDSCESFVCCIKPQIAYYEMWGHKGLEVFEKTIAYAKFHNLPVIADAKRSDISSTAQAYAKAFFNHLKADALTVNPYLGTDGIKPFTDFNTKGVFVLLKTSNSSGEEIQNLIVDGEPLYYKVASLINKWGEDSIGKRGFSNVGAVVGATFPDEAKEIRKIMPNTIFLVPGIGAQGGDPSKLKQFFNSDKLGAIINSSRDINYAYEKDGGDFKLAASKKAMETRNLINKAIL